VVIPRRGARCDPDRAGLHHGGGLVGDAVPRVGGRSSLLATRIRSSAACAR